MRDQEGTLFLLDFGAVKEIAVGSVPGGGSTGIYSMGFAPPEQMSGGQVYPATDLYALAITCLYLLTGKSAQDLYDSYHNTWHWRQFAPQVSDRLAQVIDRLLLPTPRDRYQSASETLAALSSNPPNPPSHSSTKIQGTAPPVPSPSGQVQSQRSPSFSTLELLGCAAFTGYASTLIWIATTSLFSSPGISMGLWGMMTGGLIFAQWGRIIEKLEMLVITGISTVLFWFLPLLYLKTPLVTSLFLSLSQSFPMLSTPFWGVIVMASFGALGLVAILSLFRLVYQLLRLLL
jgi:serine/threonine-protein kinase